ncbi:MAG: Ig-like domain-containing protein, partial [Chloroflexota bacterium]
MRSFTHETLQGQDGNYVWSNLKPGTYLYHSGTHAQVQVQMGLYGSVKADAAAGQAYLGQAYNSEATLLFSEIDPALHTAVANGSYGTSPAPTSTINYKPKYFLMNGAPYSASTPSIAAGQADQRVLLRLLNAGLESHVASLLGGHFQVIAEDGNQLAHPRDQYETLLPAAKTMDAIWVPAVNGTYSLYDRRNRQGMMAKLDIGGAAVAPTAVGDAYTTPAGTALTMVAPGILANDLNPTATPLTAALVTGPASGTLVLNANGSFTYTPAAGFIGLVSFTYRANNGLDSNVATVTITMLNRPPTAGNDAVLTPGNTAAVIAAVTLLANDSDPDGQPLTVTSVGGVVNGIVALAGTTVTFTPPTNFTGAASFTYTISDGQGGTATATVNVTVTAPSGGVAVAGFTLRNAATEQVIGLLPNGANIDLATLCGNCQVNFEAITSPATIVGGSVRLVLSGATTLARNDNNTPYTLPNATGAPINYAGVRLNAGLHTLTATPYSGPNATGTPGTPLTVTFTVAGPSVTGFILRNATTDQLIGPLTNGTIVSPTACNNCQFNIEAVVSGTASNVRFALTGATSRTNNESQAPYTLPGDNGPGNYNAMTLNLGAHNVTATPFISTGVSGVPLTVSFTVANSTAPIATNDAYSTPAGTALPVAAPGVLANDV